MKNILIFGANSNLAVLLAQIHHEFGDNVDGIIHQNKESIPDFVCCNDLKTIIQAEKEYELIYCIGAFVPKGRYDQPDNRFESVNIEPIRSLTNRFPNSRFVLASSVSVFGSSQSVFDENSSPSPENFYAKSKWEGEKIIASLKSYVIIRFTSIFGKSEPDNFIDRCIFQAKGNGKIEIFGDGKRMQDYIYINDAARILYLAGKTEYNGILLGVQGKSHSNREIAEIIAGFISADIMFNGVDNSTSIYFKNDFTKTILNFTPSEVKPMIERIICK